MWDRIGGGEDGQIQEQIGDVAVLEVRFRRCRLVSGIGWCGRGGGIGMWVFILKRADKQHHCQGGDKYGGHDQYPDKQLMFGPYVGRFAFIQGIFRVAADG
ncbi:MAG: hypothetical protein P4N60_17920 [Verrucomicrobiae bacterium]|nr:hypothetical protein [Verrucomicrobiae bacterium]